MDIGKILGKLPWMSKIPIQGNGMVAISKITEYILFFILTSFWVHAAPESGSKYTTNIKTLSARQVKKLETPLHNNHFNKLT